MKIVHYCRTEIDFDELCGDGREKLYGDNGTPLMIDGGNVKCAFKLVGVFVGNWK
jgi:hypothetical protein